MSKLLFAKAEGDEEAGSAQRAAAQLHGSAYVHAIRYGPRNSKEFRRAYSQHIGRFLSCVRNAARVQKSTSEPRDGRGRWTTGGTVGLSRDEVKNKVRTMLDRTKQGAVRARDIVDAAAGHEPTRPRAASYAGMAAKLVASAGGAPDDVSEMTGRHIATATGHVISRVINHPVARGLVERATGLFRKSFAPAEIGELKELVAKMVAEVDLPPQIACSDTALREVAVGAYEISRDRLLAGQ